MKLILVPAMLLAFTTALQAAPWGVESYTINPGTFHSATQFDEAGDYVIVIECHQETGAYELFVESPYDWEVDASYAPEVPAFFTIDGAEVSDVLFYFDEKQLGEGIRADTASDRLPALIGLIENASQPIGLKYFDRATTFSAEGAGGAVASIRQSCT